MTKPVAAVLGLAVVLGATTMVQAGRPGLLAERAGRSLEALIPDRVERAVRQGPAWVERQAGDVAAAAAGTARAARSELRERLRG